MKSLWGIAAAFLVSLSVVPIFAEPPKQLEPLAFLLGQWESAGSGKPGEGAGIATFARGLQERVILRTSFAEYPATATTAALRHDDLMIIYSSGSAGIRADYFDNEGHVIHYSVIIPSPGKASFISDIVPGAPRFRLTYGLETDGRLKGEFAIAPPDKPATFTRYLAWESRKATAAGEKKP